MQIKLSYEDYTGLLLSRNRIKKDVLRKYGLPSVRPCFEVMLCIWQIRRYDKDYFKIKELIKLLQENKLPSHDNSAYQAGKILYEKGLIQPIGNGRQWFRSRNWALTSRGMSFINDVEELCKKQLKKDSN